MHPAGENRMALMDHFPSNIGSFGNHGTNWPDRDEEPDYDALSGFAHLGRGWVDGLLERIAPEVWGPDAKWLETYCHANFTLAMRQDLLHVDTQMRFALWRVGSLATADGRPIYGYFVRNSGITPPPYFLVGFITLDGGILRYQVPGAVCELIRIDSPPVSPAHFVPPFPPLLPSTMWQHVLETRRERIAARLPKLPDYSLRYLITGAVGAAYRARSRAVPGLRRDGTYQWFLPIHITSASPNDAPDFIAPVTIADDGQGHVIRTLLEPHMAYPLARAADADDGRIRTWRTRS
jgi:hypothetical protein